MVSIHGHGSRSSGDRRSERERRILLTDQGRSRTGSPTRRGAGGRRPRRWPCARVRRHARGERGDLGLRLGDAARHGAASSSSRARGVEQLAIQRRETIEQRGPAPRRARASRSRADRSSSRTASSSARSNAARPCRPPRSAVSRAMARSRCAGSVSRFAGASALRGRIDELRHADRAPPVVEQLEDVGLAELDAHRPAPRSLRVVALAVAIDAAEGDRERHALRRPARTPARTPDRRCGSGGLRSCGTGTFRSRGSTRPMRSHQDADSTCAPRSGAARRA